MAVNPLLVGAGAAAAWLLFGRKADDSGAGLPPSDGGDAGATDAAKAAAIQAQLNIINAGLATGSGSKSVVTGMAVTANPANVLQTPITATAKVAGVANAIAAIDAATPVGAPNWAERMGQYPGWPNNVKPFSAYYWKIRNSINSFMEDALSRMAAIVPATYDASTGAQTGGISVVTVLANPGIDPKTGAVVNPLSGFGGYSTSTALLQFKVVGVDPASLLNVVLAGIYSSIEEVWAYNKALRQFLSFVVPGAVATELDKLTMSEDNFWTYINGTLLQSRIVAGEEWNAGVDLKYGDSGVNLHELGYNWLENWASATLGDYAQVLVASSHAAGAAIAIATAAKMGYSQTWPGDAEYTTAINRLTGLGWDSVNTRMIRDPASGLAVDVVASREQNKVVAYVPT